jgi:hypothetical protein
MGTGWEAGGGSERRETATAVGGEDLAERVDVPGDAVEQDVRCAR